MPEMLSSKINQLKVTYQNLIVGLFVGGFCGYIVKFFYQRFGASTIVFAVFILIGALLGFLSGKERERYERLNEEKILLAEDYEKVNKMLHQSENKYRLLFENISDAIYLTTDKGKFLLFNEATCILSGYSREELRRINLSALQAEREPDESQRRAWLDNGISRFEEQWRNQNGQIIHLDINAKWIKIAKVQCILHVARDFMHRREILEEQRGVQLAEFNKARLADVSKAVQILYRKFFMPMNNTMDAVNKDLQTIPSEAAKFSPFFMEWEKVRKLLQALVARSARATESGPSNWNLNEVLRQEIFNLMVVTGSDEMLKQVSLSKEIPLLYTYGRDLSLILEIVLRAVHESLPQAAKKELSVSSKMEGSLAVVQIQAPASIHFDDNLSKIIDPSLTKERDSRRGIDVLRLLVESMKWKMDIENPETGVIVRLKIPVEGSSGSTPRDRRADDSAAAGGNRQVIV
jgi:PAS domain S-box-containing protein